MNHTATDCRGSTSLVTRSVLVARPLQPFLTVFRNTGVRPDGRTGIKRGWPDQSVIIVLLDHMNVTLQSENGLLGIGPFPTEDTVDADLINAGKQTITAVPGSAYFSSADSFAMPMIGHYNECP